MNHHEMLKQCGGQALIVGVERLEHPGRDTLQANFAGVEDAMCMLQKVGKVSTAEAIRNIRGWQSNGIMWY